MELVNGESYLLKVYYFEGSEGFVLMILGPNVTMGYYKNPEANAAALEGEWLHTGDIAIVEENGSIYIVDRLKVQTRLYSQI